MPEGTRKTQTGKGKPAGKAKLPSKATGNKKTGAALKGAKSFESQAKPLPKQQVQPVSRVEDEPLDKSKLPSKRSNPSQLEVSFHLLSYACVIVLTTIP